MASTGSDMAEALEILRRLEPTLAHMSERLARIEATLPHLATKADVASKPNRAELWAAITILLAGLSVVLGALPYLERHLP